MVLNTSRERRIGTVFAALLALVVLAGCAGSGSGGSDTQIDIDDGDSLGSGGGNEDTDADARCNRVFVSDPASGHYTQIVCGDGDGTFTAELTECDEVQSVAYVQAAPEDGQVRVSLTGDSGALIDQSMTAASGTVIQNVNGDGSDSYALSIVRSGGFEGSVMVVSPCAS